MTSKEEANIAMKRRIAILLILTLVTTLLAVPAGLAESRYTASTPLTDASSNNIKNIVRAAAAINGTRVESGEGFSFNEIVGPRTKAQGYVSAENARGVSVTGGGVAQVATTLYLALMRLGDLVTYTDLHTYGSRFQDTYVADGNMAVITDYSGGTDFAFVNHTNAMTIEMWASTSALNCVITVENSVNNNWFNAPVAPVATVTAVPTATAAPTLPTTPGGPAARTYTASIPFEGSSGTRENIRLAANSVNGTQLGTGQVFSFNDVVGARTKKRGYGSGLNGRGVKVTGGGVAQVASVIWLAVKQMGDVSIIEKSTYGSRYNQDYVESSADAIVTDYKSKKNFSFRYNGPGTITIYTTIANGILRCDVVYGN